jgi:hypothetical protein
MVFSFGSVAMKPMTTSKPSAFAVTTPEIKDTQRDVTWGGLQEYMKAVLKEIWDGGMQESQEYYGINDLVKMYFNHEQLLTRLLAALGFIEGDTPVGEQINGALLDYDTIIKEYIDSIGIGTLTATQTNVTASRALDTVYQNTTGKVVEVTVSINLANDEVSVFVELDDTTPDVLIAFLSRLSDLAMTVPITFKVPNNAYYKVSKTNDAIIVKWIETTLSVS